MSTSRSTVGVAVLDFKLYAVGGRDGCSCLNSAEAYDPHTNKWTMISSMRHRRGGRGCVVRSKFLVRTFERRWRLPGYRPIEQQSTISKLSSHNLNARFTQSAILKYIKKYMYVFSV